MAQQLRLLDNGTARFRLDEGTKARGRRGIAKAREALRASAERVSFDAPVLAPLAARPPRPAPRPSPHAAPRRTDAA